MLAAIKEQEGYAEKANKPAPVRPFPTARRRRTAGRPGLVAGQYVFIDFGQVVRSLPGENPNLVKAYQKFKGKPFEIVAISLDEKKANAAEGH
jgi:hypothetical protein